MSNKIIINLAAVFTLSTLALGGVAHAGEMSTNQDAKFAQMKIEHMKELRSIGSDINNLEAQMYYSSLPHVGFGDSQNMQKQIEQLKDSAIQEIAGFHKQVQAEFGSEMANNIYTDEQIAKFEAVKKVKVENNFSSDLSAGEIMANLIEDVTGMDFSKEIAKSKMFSYDTKNVNSVEKSHS